MLQELKIFKQRTLAPSQLEVQRQLAAEKVDVGRVSGGYHYSWWQSGQGRAGLATCVQLSKLLCVLQILFSPRRACLPAALPGAATAAAAVLPLLLLLPDCAAHAASFHRAYRCCMPRTMWPSLRG